MSVSKKKKSNVPAIFFVCVVGLALICFVVWIVKSLDNTKNGYENNPAARSEKQKLLDKNLDESYPATEREVVKIYCRIQQEIYSQECTDEEIQGLFKQLRKLYDEELLAQNPYNKQYDQLLKELKKYKDEKIKITTYQLLQDSEDVEKGMYEGREQALVDVVFKTKEEDARQSFVQEFVLRKDDDNRWKILGWYKVETETGEENE